MIGLSQKGGGELRNFKQKMLHYAAKAMLGASILFFLPACLTGSHQPQVPEHLLDHE